MMVRDRAPRYAIEPVLSEREGAVHPQRDASSLAGHESQERGLSRAVATEQAHALSRADGEREPFEKRVAAEAEVYIAKSDERHGVTVRPEGPGSDGRVYRLSIVAGA